MTEVIHTFWSFDPFECVLVARGKPGPHQNVTSGVATGTSQSVILSNLDNSAQARLENE